MPPAKCFLAVCRPAAANRFLARPSVQLLYQRGLSHTRRVRRERTPPTDTRLPPSLPGLGFEPPPRSPNPKMKWRDKLRGRVLGTHVPRAPPCTPHLNKPMGRIAFRKYTRRTKKVWARRTRRQRARQRRKAELFDSDPFQVSRLILSLDAIDCPGVRPYSQKDKIEQRELWGVNGERAHLFERMLRLKEDIGVSKSKWQAKLNQSDTRRITERDVLAVAFFGVPHDKDVESSAQLAAQTPPLGYVTRSLVGSMGVMDCIADDTHHTVHMLLDRLRHQPAAKPKSGEFVGSLTGRLDLAHARRLVAPLLQTDWGRAVLSMSRDEIVNACVKADGLVPEGQHAWDIYHFLKSLSAGLLADGRTFDLSSIPAVQQLERLLLGQQSMV